ncbi:MAG: hypothetical protein E4H37_02920 [Gemmatimonadales bacterium]|nr:MAG: hypothetical protein E4H37_02920 [Gemmatimonadales bacterium]
MPQYVDLAFARCESCHDDVHKGVMASACDACHNTGGWQRINGTSFEGRFDHANTAFPLLGAHSGLECGTCHGTPARRTTTIRITFNPGADRFSYPRPEAQNCQSCHRDYHEGVFKTSPGGTTCDNCHGQEDWLPTSYGIDRHNREAAFKLTGAHQAVPCDACHDHETDYGQAHQFRIDRQDCRSCHEREDPHAGQFDKVTCDTCHDTESFTVTEFNHEATRYPLDGAHRRVACASCHQEERSPVGAAFRRYTPLGTACTDCHGGQPCPAGC